MGKAIRELAEELNLSKSGIRKYLSASFRARYTAKKSRKKMGSRIFGFGKYFHSKSTRP